MDRRGPTTDALIYGLSAAAAAGILLLASIPQYREWARIALGPYLAGAAAALAVTVLRPRRSLRWRRLVAAAVFLGAAILPLALEITWRVHTDPGLHAQSEVIVTEEAAKALVDGRDPYAADYSRGPLAARPEGTRTHFPYLPGMFVFGLPRAVGGSSAPLDARVWFLAGTAGALIAAFRARRAAEAPPEGSLLMFQALLVIPTGALLLATGGDDLPVVALLAVSFVLLERRRPVGAACSWVLAGVVKQTAWLALPFLAVAASRETPGSARRAAGWATGIAAAVIAPFLAWNPGAFVEDVVKFPLGLGSQRSAAEAPTLGSALVHVFPSARGAVTAVLALAVVAAGAVLLVRWPPRTASRAAGEAAILFTAAIALAPAARPGYLVYPVNLAVWALVLRSRQGDRASDRLPGSPIRAAASADCPGHPL